MTSSWCTTRSTTSTQDLEKKIRGGANILNVLIAEGRTVYVHCTAGMSRAPSMVLGYLVLYKGIEFEAAFRLVKESREVVCPNMEVLRKVLGKGK